MSAGYEVNIVNPRPRRRRRKAAAAPRRRRSTRRRRRNPGMMELTPSGRYVPARATRRRRNPSIGGLTFGWADTLGGAAGRLLGKVIATWAVRYFGNPEEAQISGGQSPSTGGRWTFLNHVICLLAGGAASALIGKRAPRLAARIFEGAVDMSATKAFWSEIVHRTSAGPKYLGATEEGSILEDGRGGTFIRQGGRWVSMQGLEQASSLDGLEYASSLGRRPSRRYSRPMGQLTGADPAMDDDGSVYATGGRGDPYLRAFQS